ncbi:MAG: 30S ribosomal protein S6 [Phycisphaeraceae bacterium]|nr:30S ribosomal protein S6 [Phycisphaeraceae bacterium]
MPAKRMYNYEAAFLLSQSTAADLAGAIAHINDILVTRGHAQILAMKKWDDRRLAYEIDGQKRGVYILTYFRAAGTDVAHIERDCNLSEKIMRTMILRADHLTDEEIASHDGRKELEAEARMRSDKPAQPAAETPAEAPAEAASEA